MQSSAVVTLRALVMLVCLLVVPFLAIFGSSLPQRFQSLIQGGIGVRMANSASAAHSEVADRGGDAPAFGSGGQAVPPNVEQSTAEQSLAPPAQAKPIYGADQSATLWGPNAATHGAPNLDETQRAALSNANGAAVMPAPLPTANPTPGGVPPLPAPRFDPGGEGPFRQIERRLREHGATYCLLETFGNRELSYRFYCKVSVAGDPHHTRPFDATDEDPIRAMQHVLEQVEQWRAGTEP